MKMEPFSIFIPVFNEEEILAANMGRLIAYLDQLQVSHEIILVSNGSTDDSERIGRELQARHARILFLALPDKGVGRAFKQGITAARYDRIIFLDADLSADLSFIAKAACLLDNHVLVLGTKRGGLQNRSLFRKMGSYVFYLSVIFVMGLRYTDYAPGAKAYQKSFLLKYFDEIDDYTSFVLNLTFIAAVKHLPLAEITIACEDRRKSRYNLWKEALSKYRGLFSLKTRQVMRKL